MWHLSFRYNSLLLNDINVLLLNGAQACFGVWSQIAERWLHYSIQRVLINSRFCLIVMRELGNLDIGRGKEKMHTHTRTHKPMKEKWWSAFTSTQTIRNKRDLPYFSKCCVSLQCFGNARLLHCSARFSHLNGLILTDACVNYLFRPVWYCTARKHLGMGCCRWLRWMP